MLAAMQEAARVAAAMLDGEEAKLIVMERAFRQMASPNPKFPHMGGDYFDVDAAQFLRMKKSLLRLARLLDFEVGTTLWVPVKGRADHVTAAVHNGTLHRYWTFGQLLRKADGALAECLLSGIVTTVAPETDDRWLTVLAPVRDSLGDVAALVEITAMNPAADSLAPVWN
jgi:hypothetical protein